MSTQPSDDAILGLADTHADESHEDGRRTFDRGGLLQFARDITALAQIVEPMATMSTQDTPLLRHKGGGVIVGGAWIQHPNGAYQRQVAMVCSPDEDSAALIGTQESLSNLLAAAPETAAERDRLRADLDERAALAASYREEAERLSAKCSGQEAWALALSAECARSRAVNAELVAALRKAKTCTLSTEVRDVVCAAIARAEHKGE